MKLPRSVSGADVIRALGRADFAILRQEGSHVRLGRGTVRHRSGYGSSSHGCSTGNAQGHSPSVRNDRRRIHRGAPMTVATNITIHVIFRE